MAIYLLNWQHRKVNIKDSVNITVSENCIFINKYGNENTYSKTQSLYIFKALI